MASIKNKRTIPEIAKVLERNGLESLKRSKEQITPVIFRVWNRSTVTARARAASVRGEVIALFPTLPYSATDSGLVTCYSHIGQHGAASLGIIKDTRPATPKEYASLKQELESGPYNYKLKVYTRVGLHLQLLNAKRRSSIR